ncbi:MAG TPA: SH3 domain-containing protein [Terriglobales bacterium]|nr:SH3 domain-containing protein [Terriglobales bacterium]
MESPRKRLLVLLLAAVVLFSACGRGRQRVLDIAYVSAPQVTLRDQLAQVYSKVGVAKNGERVEVLDRQKRFARVRTQNGAEGWVEQRYLVSRQVFERFQMLTRQETDTPVQGIASTRNDTNLHVEPGRDTDHLYQVAQGAKVSILKRASVEKNLPGAAKPAAGAKEVKAMEDWWLVRDAQGHVGWILGRMMDLDVPLEVAQYAEGQRIVACFVLNEVKDGDSKVPQYLMLLTEPKDGMPFDYNQARVFTWNVRKHRYETAYRERKLEGALPVTISHQIFEKEGDLPTFVLRVRDASGNIVERKYKLNTPIVRRVG